MKERIQDQVNNVNIKNRNASIHPHMRDVSDWVASIRRKKPRVISAFSFSFSIGSVESTIFLANAVNSAPLNWRLRASSNGLLLTRQMQDLLNHFRGTHPRDYTNAVNHNQSSASRFARAAGIPPHSCECKKLEAHFVSGLRNSCAWIGRKGLSLIVFSLGWLCPGQQAAGQCRDV